MIKYKNSVILHEIDKPFFVCKEANDTHNELTIVTRYYAINLHNILPKGTVINKQLWDTFFKVARGFRNVKMDITETNTTNEVRFASRINAKAVLLFGIKAKTERRKEDDNDIELAKKIVLSKVNKQAYKFTEKIIMSIFAYFMDSSFEIAEILKKMVRCNKRESAYFSKLKNKQS